MSGNTLKDATYVPIETNNAIQITQICSYMPRAYLSVGYRANTIAISENSPYTLSGQLALAATGYVMYQANNTTPGYLAGVQCNDNITAK